MTRSAVHPFTRFVLASLGVLLASAVLKGDIEQRASSSDFDAEFARAAESLEAGKRREAEQALESIRLRSAERAWEARIAFLLAADDLRRKDFAAAVRRLRLAPAASIGLEPYRLMLLGRALDAAGQLEAAAREYRAAFETEESFAARAAAGRALAAALEKRGDRKGAGAALARVAAAASRSGPGAVAPDRIRIGLAINDAAAVHAASRDLLFAGVAPETAPALERTPLKQELARLSAADRGRLGVVLVSAGSVERGVRLLKMDRPAAWPAAERAFNLLGLARGEARLGHDAAAERAEAAVPRDGSDADFDARLLRIDRSLDAARKKTPKRSPADRSAVSARAALTPLAAAPAPPSVRIGPPPRPLRLDCDADRFEDALAKARPIERESPGS